MCIDPGAGIRLARALSTAIHAIYSLASAPVADMWMIPSRLERIRAEAAAVIDRLQAQEPDDED